MTQLILDAANQITGYTHDDQQAAWEGVRLVPAPDGFNPALLAHYTAKVAKGKTTITLNMEAALTAAKAACCSLIKEEAARLIAATDWKLQRAQERDAAGWGSLAEIDQVLTEREAIRQSSNAAELAANALTDITTVQTFTWSIDVPVSAPNRLTRGQFLDRFTKEERAAILVAAEANGTLKAWVMRLENSDWIKPAEATPGLQALEIAGLIQPGRAVQILS
ncbi:hypothetical protein [Undibacterium umbellatum]|uniref:Uncharacterized protein n=1 Tax=Undibacterium umbellatum TaxID=2762300 RepID=A0ABR6ZIJ1_9BURK|nr:hypothetical protein [Undibacterium umbellatum]MBC3911538.1 hypothetical protein [Undibacterium umbellatum]